MRLAASRLIRAYIGGMACGPQPPIAPADARTREISKKRENELKDVRNRTPFPTEHLANIPANVKLRVLTD